MPEGKSLLGRLEKTLGLPELSQVKATLNEVNTLIQGLDEKRLGTVKHVADTLLKLQKEGGVEGLRMFSTVVDAVAGMETAKLDKIVQIMADVRATADTVQKMMKMLPPGALKDLPISEIAGAVKQAMAEK